mmetsp:Transcript_32951/g.75880  ORF Transcript_32951/g.75880 Transcript_32951/m.75880 type:complete len:174 (-) Transcript_32951:428-949(-)
MTHCTPLSLNYKASTRVTCVRVLHHIIYPISLLGVVALAQKSRRRTSHRHRHKEDAFPCAPPPHLHPTANQQDMRRRMFREERRVPQPVGTRQHGTPRRPAEGIMREHESARAPLVFKSEVGTAPPRFPLHVGVSRSLIYSYVSMSSHGSWNRRTAMTCAWQFRQEGDNGRWG